MGTEKVGVVADIDFIDILSLPLLALWDWHNIMLSGVWRVDPSPTSTPWPF